LPTLHRSLPLRNIYLPPPTHFPYLFLSGQDRNINNRLLPISSYFSLTEFITYSFSMTASLFTSLPPPTTQLLPHIFFLDKALQIDS
jgi:hypothetical protein